MHRKEVKLFLSGNDYIQNYNVLINSVHVEKKKTEL